MEPIGTRLEIPNTDGAIHSTRLQKIGGVVHPSVKRPFCISECFWCGCKMRYRRFAYAMVGISLFETGCIRGGAFAGYRLWGLGDLLDNGFLCMYDS